jgi:hypothetical protein
MLAFARNVMVPGCANGEPPRAEIFHISQCLREPWCPGPGTRFQGRRPRQRRHPGLGRHSGRHCPQQDHGARRRDGYHQQLQLHRRGTNHNAENLLVIREATLAARIRLTGRAGEQLPCGMSEPDAQVRSGRHGHQRHAQSEPSFSLSAPLSELSPSSLAEPFSSVNDSHPSIKLCEFPPESLGSLIPFCSAQS